MFDFSGNATIGDWGINIGQYPNVYGSQPTYPYGYQVPTPYYTPSPTTSNNQILMLGLIVLAFIVLTKR